MPITPICACLVAEMRRSTRKYICNQVRLAEDDELLTFASGAINVDTPDFTLVTAAVLFSREGRAPRPNR